MPLTAPLTFIVGVGTLEHIEIAVDEFLGLGVPVVKSMLLLFESPQPLLILIPAFVLDKTGATVPSEQLADPNPTRSMI